MRTRDRSQSERLKIVLALIAMFVVGLVDARRAGVALAFSLLADVGLTGWGIRTEYMAWQRKVAVEARVIQLAGLLNRRSVLGDDSINCIRRSEFFAC